MSSDAVSAFKKTQRVAHTDVNKNHFEESLPSHNVVIPTDIWTEYYNIPAVAPIAVGSLVLLDEGVAVQAVTPHFQNTMVAVSGNSYAYTLSALRNSIPYNWDSTGSYQPILYDNAGTTVIPFDLYDLDWAAGVVTFRQLPAPPVLPTDLLAALPKISFYEYSGAVGIDAQDVDNMVTIETQAAHGFAVGRIVRRSGVTWVAAQADSVANASECFMVVDIIPGTPSGQFKASNLGKHTLATVDFLTTYAATVGAMLYLSSAAGGATGGLLTTTAPGIKTPIAKIEGTNTVQLFPAIPVDTTLTPDDIQVQQSTVLAAWKPVRFDDATNLWVLAQSDLESTLATHLVIRSNTDASAPANSWIIRHTGIVSGIAHGLGADGTKLYLSNTSAGSLLTSAPATALQQHLAQIIDSTTLLVYIHTENKTSTDNEITVTSATIAVGDPVYFNGTNWVKATAAALASVATHVVVRQDPYTATTFYLANSGLYDLGDYTTGPSVTWLTTAGGVGKWLYVGTNNASRVTLYNTDANPPSIDNRLVYVVSGNTVLLHPNAVHDNSTLPNESRVTGTLVPGDAYYQNATGVWTLANATRPTTAATHLCTRNDPLGMYSYVANNGRVTVAANLNTIHSLAAGNTFYGAETAGDLTATKSRVVNRLGTVESVGASSVVLLKSEAPRMDQPEVYVEQTAHGLLLGDGVYMNAAATPIWVRAVANALTTVATHVVTRRLDANDFYVAKTGDYDFGIANYWDANDVPPGTTTWETYAGGKNVALYLTEASLAAGPFDTNANVQAAAAPIRNLLMYTIAGNRVRVNVSQPLNEIAKQSEIVVTQVTATAWVGQPVYQIGVNNWAQAKADTLATAGTHIVTRLHPFTANTVMVAASGDHNIGTHGLTIGTLYYVSETSAGGLTTTEPFRYSNPILVPTSTTNVEVLGGNTIDNSRVNNEIELTHTNPIAPNQQFSVGKAIYYNAASGAWELAYSSTSTTVASHVLTRMGPGTVWYASSHGRFVLNNPPFSVDANGIPTAITAETDTWATAFGANTKLYCFDDPTAANQGWLTKSSPTISNQLLTVETGNTVFINVHRVENGLLNSNRIRVNQAGMTVGEAYYMTGATWIKAQANSMATVGTHIVAEQDPYDAANYYLIDSGHFTKTAHGMTVGGLVYVSNTTTGLLTSTQPDADQWPRISNPVGIALDVNTVDLFHVMPADISLTGTEEHIGDFAGLAVGDAIYYTGSTWALALATATNTLASHMVTRKQSGNKCYAATSGVWNMGVFEGANSWETHFGLNTRVYVSDVTYASVTRSLASTLPTYQKQIALVESGNNVRITPGQFTDNSLKHHEIRVVQTGGDALAVGNAVFFDGTKWEEAETSDPTKSPTHLVVRAGESYEATGTVFLASTGVHDLGVAHSGAAGNVMYNGIAGAITTTAQNNSTVIGTATSTTAIALAFGKLEQPFGTRVVQAAHGFYDGAPVRFDNISGEWELAVATTMDNCATHIVGKSESATVFYYTKSGRFDLGNFNKAGGVEDIVNNSLSSADDDETWLTHLAAIKGDRLYLSAVATEPYSVTPADFHQQLAIIEDGNILHICIGDPIDKVGRDTDTYITSALAVEKLVYWDGAAWVVAANTSRTTMATHMVVKDPGGGLKLISAYGEYTVSTHGYALGVPLYLGTNGDLTATKPTADSDTIIQVCATATSATNLMLKFYDIIDQTFDTRGRVVTQVAHGFDQGDAIYHTGTAWADAQGDRSVTLATHVVIKRIDANDFVYASTGRYVFNNYNYFEHGAVDDTDWATQFAAGALLYTSNVTAGLVTSTKPANDSLSNSVMVVESANTVHVIVSSHDDSQKISLTVTQATPTFAIGNVIYYDKDATRWELAHASATTQQKSGTHLVYHIDAADATTFKACSSGRVDFGSAVLTSNTPGWWYVSDSTPGLLVSVEPVPVSNPICVAESDQVVHVIPMRAVTSGVTETDAAVAFNVNQNAHGLVIGDVVYRGASGWAKAKSNAVATVGTHIVGDYFDAANFLLVSSGKYQFTGLNVGNAPYSATVGDWLFLSDATDGQMSKTEGIISNPVGNVEAVGANSVLNIHFMRPAAKGFTSTTVTNDGLTVNQAGLIVERAVYLDTGGIWQWADSGVESTLGTHVVVQDLGGNNFVLASSGTATISAHSMGTVGQWFFVDQAASGAVTNNPTGNYSNPLGFVIDASTIQMYHMRATQLSQAAAGAGHRWFATANVTANGSNPDSYGTPIGWASDDRYTLVQTASNTTYSAPTVAAGDVHISWYSSGANKITFILENQSGVAIYFDVVAIAINGTAANYSVTLPAGFGAVNNGTTSVPVDVSIRDLTGASINNATDIRVNIRRIA